MSEFLDLNGKQVHEFAVQMGNLGFRVMTDKLVSMLDSGAWMEFKDGLGPYEFLEGEFDYFLTQQGVTRDDVMNGVTDIDVKARLERHMDERRTGEENYRRRLTEAREANPQRPERPIEPFGYTEAERKRLVNGTASAGGSDRAALGTRVRRYTNNDGQTTKTASDTLPPVERLRRAAFRLDDDDLADLAEFIKQEQRRRRRAKKDTTNEEK